MLTIPSLYINKPFNIRAQVKQLLNQLFCGLYNNHILFNQQKFRSFNQIVFWLDGNDSAENIIID